MTPDPTPPENRKVKVFIYLQKGDLMELQVAVENCLKCGFEPFGTTVPFAYQKRDESRGTTLTVYSYIQAMAHYGK